MDNKLLNFIKDSLETERPNYVEKTVGDVYESVAQKHPELSREDIAAIGGIESQHGKLKNTTGSARGLMQFMPKTADFLKKKLAEKGKNIPEDEGLRNLNTQEDLMTELVGYNKDRLSELKGEDYTPTIEDLYVLHNLGEGYGKKFLTAPKTDILSDVIPEEIVEANPKLYQGDTVGQAKDNIKKQLDKNSKSFKFNPRFIDLLRK